MNYKAEHFFSIYMEEVRRFLLGMPAADDYMEFVEDQVPVSKNGAERYEHRWNMVRHFMNRCGWQDSGVEFISHPYYWKVNDYKYAIEVLPIGQVFKNIAMEIEAALFTTGNRASPSLHTP